MPVLFFFFFTLVTGPRRSLSLELSDTRVYEPQIPCGIHRRAVGPRTSSVRGHIYIYIYIYIIYLVIYIYYIYIICIYIYTYRSFERFLSFWDPQEGGAPYIERLRSTPCEERRCQVNARELCGGSEEGSHLRLIDLCITQLYRLESNTEEVEVMPEATQCQPRFVLGWVLSFAQAISMLKH